MIIIAERDQLRAGYEGLEIEKVDYSHLRISHEPWRDAVLVIFVDGDKAKLLKSRYLSVQDKMVEPGDIFNLISQHIQSWRKPPDIADFPESLRKLIQ